MSLMDTADEILMLGAYGGAFMKPIRKLYYNITVTSVSVTVAVLIGAIETIGLVAGEFHFNGFFWDTVRSVNGHFGMANLFIVAIFIAGWVASVIVYQVKGYEAS